MEGKCVNCSGEFAHKQKTRQRKSLDAKLPHSSKSGIEVLEHEFDVCLTPGKPRFLCLSCARVLAKLQSSGENYDDSCRAFSDNRSKEGFLFKKLHSEKADESFRSKLSNLTRSPIYRSPKRRKIGTPVKGVSTVISTSKIISNKRNAIKNIQQSKYLQAFNILSKKSCAARNAIIQSAVKMIQKEMKQFCKKDTPTAKPVTVDNMSSFNWEDIMNELKKEVPATFACVKSVVTKQTRGQSCKDNPTIARFGSLLMGLLHARAPLKFKFLVGVNSVQMWKNGCSDTLFKCFNKLGYCLSKTRTRSLVDSLKKSHDTKIVQWKNEIEADISSPAQEHCMPRAARRLDYSDREDSGTNHDTMSESIPDTEKNPGFSLAWDNVQVETTARYQSTTQQNKMLMWAMAYAAKNRITFRHLDNEKSTVRACEIPLTTFIPSQDTYTNLRRRMEIIVSRIICDHFVHFSTYYADCVPNHVPHDYSLESARKSELVNLGVVQENPSSLQGVIAILDWLHQYVPTARRQDDPFHVIMCQGDGLSIERHVDAQRARAGSTTARGRLSGLEPVSQEFHKRGIILQDIMDEFFRGSSAANRGTLAHAKNTFNHRAVKAKVMDNFNHVTDFLKFVTEGLVCLLTIQKLRVTSLDSDPSDSVYEESLDERKEYLNRLAKDVVSVIWLQVNTDDLQELIKEDEQGAGNSGDNGDGDGGGVNDDSASDDYPYCFCGEDVGGTMIECSNAECGYGRWFHLPCVLLNEDTVPETDDWFCTDTCRGLNDLVRRDAVRENDGPAMLEHWKIDSLDFWQKNHFKYMILAHRLISGVSGWLPKRMAEEVTWNRTINLHGGEGKNIAMDLATEFLNNEFKGTLKHSRGRYTDQQVARMSQMAGSFGKIIEQLYQTNLTESHVGRSKGGQPNYKCDVAKFVSEYKDDQLFDIHNGRQHSAFPGYHFNTSIDNPSKLMERLKLYAKKLDSARDALPE
ncbi:uncharacterized protein [Ptychodera flava]|uniref:uncharacterized protein isoform X3 n=1 Tax=Ptychodera flava TaxID=63121 RepID=UPI00396A2D04